MFAGLVVGAERVDRIDERQAPLDLGHMRGRFAPLHGGEPRLRPLADFGRRPRGAFRQQLAQLAPAKRQRLQGGQHRVGIAKTQLQTVSVVCGENPVLEALHGPGNGGARR